MASRVTAGHWVRAFVVLVLGVALFVALLVVTGVPVPQLRATACGAFGAVVAVDRIMPSCVGPARASAALAAGRTAEQRRAYREALGHYRAAVSIAPNLPAAHVARGDAAYLLAEYEEALDSFQAAARLAPSVDTAIRVGAAAERLGRIDLAVQTLDTAYGPWRHHAGAGTRAAATKFAACAPTNLSSPQRLWQTCVSGAREAYAASFDASREIVPRMEFRMLFEDGRRDRALAFARDRGWVREGADYCGKHTVPIDAETSALLATLTQPERADCAVTLAASLADEGSARLARALVLDRLAHARGDARARAEEVLRHHLPNHEVSRVAEVLNAAGWRLQHVHDAADEAVLVYEKAIAADPRFSWPYHNIGRLYMGRGDYEQARVWLERALDVEPEHWRALYDDGMTNANLKRWPAALSAYRKAAAITPNDARLHANIGWTLVELGQQAEADRELEAALRLDPSLQSERTYLSSRPSRDARSAPRAAAR